MIASKRLCPECSTEMQTITALQTVTVGLEKKIEIEKCPNCEGLFFDNQELQDLVSCLKEYPVDSAIRFDTETANGSIWDREQYKCPICGEKMQKAYYEVKSSVAFDYCLGHGVYLNKGELTAIIRWKKENMEPDDPEILATYQKKLDKISKRVNSSEKRYVSPYVKYSKVVDYVLRKLAGSVFYGFINW